MAQNGFDAYAAARGLVLDLSRRFHAAMRRGRHQTTARDYSTIIDSVHYGWDTAIASFVPLRSLATSAGLAVRHAAAALFSRSLALPHPPARRPSRTAHHPSMAGLADLVRAVPCGARIAGIVEALGAARAPPEAARLLLVGAAEEWLAHNWRRLVRLVVIVVAARGISRVVVIRRVSVSVRHFRIRTFRRRPELPW